MANQTLLADTPTEKSLHLLKQKTGRYIRGQRFYALSLKGSFGLL